MVMTTGPSPDPVPDSAQAKRPGNPPAPKVVRTSRGGSFPKPTRTGAGQGRVLRGGRKGR
jgi:hypothetical protein